MTATEVENPSLLEQAVSFGQENTTTAIAVGVIVLFLLVFILLKSKSKGGVKGRTLFIVGECGSGKTTLLYQLADYTLQGTTSSLIPNTAKVNIKDVKNSNRETEIDVADIPGHNHLKRQFLESISEAKGIVLMVDSSDKAQLQNVSDYLYRILINPVYQEKNIPILIVCNKQDLATARKLNIVEEDFINEIERFKISKRAIEDENSKDDYLRLEHNRFTFGRYPIKFCESSLVRGETQQIKKFISDLYF